MDENIATSEPTGILKTAVNKACHASKNETDTSACPTQYYQQKDIIELAGKDDMR